jgi:prevent-host-death family protein
LTYCHIDLLEVGMQTISVGEAKSRFSELISRTAAGERFLIERRERPVAVLISAAELERLERASRAARRLALALGQDSELIRRVDAQEIHPAMAAFGLWRDEEDLAALTEETLANREAQGIRPSVDLCANSARSKPACRARAGD